MERGGYLMLTLSSRDCSSRKGKAKLSRSGGVHMTRVACRGRRRLLADLQSGDGRYTCL